MDFETAKTLLSASFRWELRDHAFGDTEFGWKDAEGNEIAEGYSGGGRFDIWFMDRDELLDIDRDEARELRRCGILKDVERNDETGPDHYIEGLTMPGLTLEGVREELTKEP